MNTGLKVWLWIVFVINIISGVMMIPLMLIQPLLIVSLIAEVLIIVGAGLILFAQKKVGFYLMIACAAIGLVINIFGGVGVVKSIISAVPYPLHGLQSLSCIARKVSLKLFPLELSIALQSVVSLNPEA